MTRKSLCSLKLHDYRLKHLWRVLLLTLPVASPPFPVLTGIFVQTGGRCGSRGRRGTVGIGAEVSPVWPAAPPAGQRSDWTASCCPADGECVLVVLLQGCGIARYCKCQGLFGSYTYMELSVLVGSGVVFEASCSIPSPQHPFC